MNKFATMTLSVLSVLGVSSALANPPDDVAQVELVPGWTTSEGAQMAGVRISLAPGWHTYWRAPGDAGIPPQFSWSQSSNLKAVRVHWPRPEVFDQDGMRTIGYADDVILPIEFFAKDKGAAVEVSGQISMGVCKDICLPVTLDMTGKLGASSGSTEDTAALKRALSDRPDSARTAGAGTVTCAIAPIKDGLKITAKIPVPYQGGNEVVVFETGRDDVWISATESSRNGDVLVASAEFVPPEAQPFAMDRSKLRTTVLGRDGAVDIRGCKSG